MLAYTLNKELRDSDIVRRLARIGTKEARQDEIGFCFEECRSTGSVFACIRPIP